MQYPVANKGADADHNAFYNIHAKIEQRMKKQFRTASRYVTTRNNLFLLMGFTGGTTVNVNMKLLW